MTNFYYDELLWWHLRCYHLYEAEYASYYALDRYYPGS
jgi:hypothetical protein